MIPPGYQNRQWSSRELIPSTIAVLLLFYLFRLQAMGSCHGYDVSLWQVNRFWFLTSCRAGDTPPGRPSQIARVYIHIYQQRGFPAFIDVFLTHGTLHISSGFPRATEHWIQPSRVGRLFLPRHPATHAAPGGSGSGTCRGGGHGNLVILWDIHKVVPPIVGL